MAFYTIKAFRILVVQKGSGPLSKINTRKTDFVTGGRVRK
jgi:hypothetical protein